MTDHVHGSRDDDSENVFALAARLARRASDGQLVGAAAAGILAASLVGFIRPDLWWIGLPLICMGSFGVWGIAERTATERTARLGPDFGGRRALTSLRLTAAVVGTLAGVMTLLVIVARMVGTWKS